MFVRAIDIFKIKITHTHRHLFTDKVFTLQRIKKAFKNNFMNVLLSVCTQI